MKTTPALDALGKRFGKRLALSEEYEDVFVVNEVDRDGLIVGQWGTGATEAEAVGHTKTLFEMLHLEVSDADAGGALLATARLLPSDVLRAVLLERGEFHLEVK